MNEDKARVELLLDKFTPRILRLAINFISFDSTVQKLSNYLMEHKDSGPELRELYQTLLKLEGTEVNELEILSRNIAYNRYDLDEIIPIID